MCVSAVMISSLRGFFWGGIVTPGYIFSFAVNQNLTHVHTFCTSQGVHKFFKCKELSLVTTGILIITQVSSQSVSCPLFLQTR